jgi:flagellar motor protein MotB
MVEAVMSQRTIYEAGHNRSLGWPMMLADMGLLLMAFFALMVAQSNHPASAARVAPTDTVAEVNVPKDAESLLAHLRDKRIPFEPLDLTTPNDLPDEDARMAPVQVAIVPKDAVEDLRLALIDHIPTRNFSVERAGDSVVVSLGAVGNFAAGSADLDMSAQRSIQLIADVIGDVKSEIAIEGHADSSPIVSARYKDNWELAGARAVAVLRELSRSPHLAASSLRAVSFGDRRPAIVSADPKERERNRRVEIRIRPI